MLVEPIIKVLESSESEIIFNINTIYTETYYNTVDNNYELRFLTNETYISLEWTGVNFTSTEMFPIVESTGTYNLKFITNGEDRNYTLVIPSNRNTTPIGGLLRFNTSELEIISTNQISGLKQLKEYDINWITSELNCDLVLPTISINLKKWTNKLINFKEGDYLMINGFKLVFKSTPTQINHIKYTNKPKEDFLALYEKILLIEDPRLKKDLFEYKFIDDTIILTGLLDIGVFDMVIEPSYRTVQNEPFAMFDITPIKADWLEVYFGYDSTPIISNWQTPGCIDVIDPTHIGIKIIRYTNNTNRWIDIKQVNLKFISDIPKLVTSNWVFSKANEAVIISPADQYKVFKLTGFKINASQPNELTINFRWSDNNGRNWSYWMPLTTPNLVAQKINPLGFFKIEYTVTKVSNSVTYLYDIELIGDFVNITCNYMKYGILGINTCCSPNILGDGDADCKPNPYENMISDPDLLWKPYKKDEVFEMYKKRLNTLNDMFGWNVEYYKRDPDFNSADPVLHEYGLYNTISKSTVRIIVPENQFPDRKLNMNQFSMGLIDKFIINISKEEFKKHFGLTYRPGKNDVIKFCDVNLLYIVEQAYPAYDFMNMSTYYEVVLDKYKDKANVGGGDKVLEKELTDLIKYNTLDTLFGIDAKREEDRVTKQTYQPLTREWCREWTNDNVNSMNQIIEAKSIVMSPYQYDMSLMKLNEHAVTYTVKDPSLSEGQGRSWTLMFNLLVNVGSKRTLMQSNNWEIWTHNYNVNFTINDVTYTLDCTGMTTKKWHALVINMDQPRRDIEMTVFSIDTKKGINEAYKKYWSHVPTSWSAYGGEIDNCTDTSDGVIVKNDIKLFGGPHYLTNLRIFNKMIPKDKYIYILQQNQLQDTEDIILIDNAQPVQILPNFGGINVSQY